jgi:16S rRNA (cytosine1402-N4)-methyltransferase
MVAEVMELLTPSSGDFTVETMVGAGGHAAEFLRRTSPDGRLLGIDRDPAILEVARGALEPFKHRVTLREGCSDALRDILAESGTPAPQIVFMDLGVSSMQLDDPARGFSFQGAGPLDMRMSPRGPTAADLLARKSADELEAIFREHGDEPFARKIARAIVARRRTAPFRTTRDLAEHVAGLVPGRLRGRRHVHPATRVFQALRIAVNDEHGMLERTLPAAWDALAPGGRLGVISFHSGEDRVVKRFVRDLHQRRLAQVLTKKPIRPGADEAARNPRSRSAKLRGARKTEDEA